ncbi:MAG: M23 family metallopeptidase, partial [Acidobacteriota bacterium]
MTRKTLIALVVALGLLVVGCSDEEIVPEPYLPSDAWDAYRHGLEQAGLLDTALGEDWRAAAAAALESPVRVELPYREVGYLETRAAEAVGYRFRVLRGQRVEVVLQVEAEEPMRVFLDAFRPRPEQERGEQEGALVPIASAPEGERRLYFEARRDAEYVVRIQPELLRGGRYELTILADASLQFPVQGLDTSAIQSAFGAPRDAGRRSHHGVDIFAERNTPVLAAADALVRRVGETPVGGRVVWLYDRERSLHLYYAHLESHEVEERQEVAAGEIVGRVGNSGNARTTPPHLHFGIYVRGEGPRDPDPFLRRVHREPASVRAPGGPL